MRILIIDDSEDFRILAAQLLSIEWPDIEVEEYDPLIRGKLNVDAELGAYDAILLDHQLGNGEDGLQWLRELKRRPHCPPILFVTEFGNEEVAAKSIKFGAHDYLSKQELSRQKLVKVLQEVTAPAATTTGELDRTLALEGSGGTPNAPPLVTRNAACAPLLLQAEDISIGGYRILHRIGRGGMADVFLAERTKDRLQLVLKILDAKLVESETYLKRFVHEYSTIAHIDSPYVVKIYEQGFTDRHVFIAMEYFAMGDLKKYMRDLSSATAFKFFYHMIKALVVIHNTGVLHRDLKPQNIMFRENGSLALVDFGIAKVLNDTQALTTHGEIYGTPYYMSPEQVGGAKVDARSDLYSAGVILYEMLTGMKLFTGSSAIQIAEQHVHAPAPRLPPSLAQYQAFMDKLLAKTPSERYQSARDLLADLAFALLPRQARG